MNKTPDEIKKGLIQCIDNEADCTGCPYEDVEACHGDLMEDTFALIQQLEAKLEEEKTHHQHTLECAQSFEEEWVQMKRERNAAIADLKHGMRCEACKHCGTDYGAEPCESCMANPVFDKDNWEWRGVQENGGTEG